MTCAARRESAGSRASQLNAFLGLGRFRGRNFPCRGQARKRGEIPAPADHGPDWPTASAPPPAQSTNIEFVSQLIKLGGNGPIMANALASFGLQVTYLGNLRLSELASRFRRLREARRGPLHRRAGLHGRPGVRGRQDHARQASVATGNELGEHQGEVWPGQIHRKNSAVAILVGFVNWTMLTHMNEIWAAAAQGNLPGTYRPAPQRCSSTWPIPRNGLMLMTFSAFRWNWCRLSRSILTSFSD